MELGEKKLSMQTCNVLSDLRENGQLCDVIIQVEGQAFPVHKIMMTACSPYFRALFTSSMRETGQEVVEIPYMSAKMMTMIIEYAYTGKVVVDTENVEQLSQVADYLNVKGLLQLCCGFLKANLTNENCIGVRNFARFYFFTELADSAMQYILTNAQEIFTQSDEMLELSVEEMVELLEHEELNVKTEEPAFEALIRWIDYKPNERKCHIFTLLRNVRLYLLGTSYFVEKVKAHPYVTGSEECRPLIIDTLKFLYDLDISDEKEFDLANPLARPRIPYEIIFAIGGWSGGSPTNVIETYDTRADRWYRCDFGDPQGPRAYHGTATIDGLVYICGGFDGVEYFNSVRCFNPIAKIWCSVSPMYARRCYVSVTVLNKCIYAMGGFDGTHRQNTAECYDPTTNQWSLIAPMHQQRSDANATTLNGKVFIIGGFNGSECMSSGEFYTPETNQWTNIAPMRTRRSGIGIMANKGCIFAIGGFNGMSRLKTGEKWDPEKNQWTPISDMYTARSNYAIEVIDNMIFVIGGFDGSHTIFNVECYDDKSNEWLDATDMNVYRSAVSACVIKGLPNRREYIPKSQDTLNSDNRNL